jgi:HlyD family secretion protein
MNSKKRRIIIAAIVLIIAIIVIKITLFGDKFYYAGTIEATKVDISARISSVINSIPVKEGNHINKGVLLLTLSCEDIKISLEQAQKDYERAYKLYRQGSVPQENYEHMKAKYDDTRLKMEWCEIKSPVSGTILTKYREEGELVQYGTKLFTIADMQDLWANIYVPQPIIAKLKLGMELNGYLPELGMKRLKGKITKISEEAEFTPKNVQTREERTRLVFAIKVSFDNSENILKPGMSIEVKVQE